MAESKFVIQGIDYPVPDWISFTMDESEILYARTGLTLADIDEDVKFTPGLLATMMIVAYMRGNPTAPRARAEKIIGAIQIAEVIESLFPDRDEEEDAGPPSPAPSETSLPGEPVSSVDSPSSSGNDGSPDSERTAGPPAPTGMPRLVTPPESDQATSVG